MVNYKDIYFDKLLESVGSGVIQLSIPVATEGGTTNVPMNALLEDNIRIKTENKWGTLVPSLDSLSQVSQLLGKANLVSWINGSSAAWESTEPMEVSFQMRLITLSSEHDILMQMAMLQSLTALRVDGALTVNAHGGYKNNFWTNNEDIGEWYNKDKVKKELSAKLGSDLASYGEEGTVTIKFGNLTIGNLLVSNINTQVSKVLCRNLQPLWIKIDITLRGVRALLIKDLQKMVPNTNLPSTPEPSPEPNPEPSPEPKLDLETVEDIIKSSSKVGKSILPVLLANPATVPLAAPIAASVAVSDKAVDVVKFGVKLGRKLMGGGQK